MWCVNVIQGDQSTKSSHVTRDCKPSLDFSSGYLLSLQSFRLLEISVLLHCRPITHRQIFDKPELSPVLVVQVALEYSKTQWAVRANYRHFAGASGLSIFACDSVSKTITIMAFGKAVEDFFACQTLQEIHGCLNSLRAGICLECEYSVLFLHAVMENCLLSTTSHDRTFRKRLYRLRRLMVMQTIHDHLSRLWRNLRNYFVILTFSLFLKRQVSLLASQVVDGTRCWSFIWTLLRDFSL